MNRFKKKNRRNWARTSTTDLNRLQSAARLGQSGCCSNERRSHLCRLEQHRGTWAGNDEVENSSKDRQPCAQAEPKPTEQTPSGWSSYWEDPRLQDGKALYYNLLYVLLWRLSGRKTAKRSKKKKKRWQDHTNLAVHLRSYLAELFVYLLIKWGEGS